MQKVVFAFSSACILHYECRRVDLFMQPSVQCQSVCVCVCVYTSGNRGGQSGEALFTAGPSDLSVLTSIPCRLRCSRWRLPEPLRLMGNTGATAAPQNSEQSRWAWSADAAGRLPPSQPPVIFFRRFFIALLLSLAFFLSVTPPLPASLFFRVSVTPPARCAPQPVSHSAPLKSLSQQLQQIWMS